MQRITSIKDPIIEEARNLQSSKYRKQSNRVLLYGVEQLRWAENALITIEYIFVEQKNANILSFCSAKDKIIYVTSGILKKISNTNYIIPCMAVGSLNKSNDIDDEFIIVMDNLQDFGNIGSIVRTSKGFSVEQFILSGMETDPYQRKIIDSSRGQVFGSIIRQSKSEEDTIKYLKSNNYYIISTSPYAQTLQSQATISSKKIALIVGNETEGVNDLLMQASDAIIKIPMNTQVESLNVSVSAGISIYELKFKQALIMLKEKIFADFGRQINVTGKLIRMVFDKEMKQFTDLSGMQVILMMIMHCDGKMTTYQISKDISLLENEIEDFIKPLLTKKYIEKKNSEYYLLDNGKKFLAEIWPITQRTHEKIMNHMSKEEIEQLKILLSKIQTSCMKLLEQEG